MHVIYINHFAFVTIGINFKNSKRLVDLMIYTYIYEKMCQHGHFLVNIFWCYFPRCIVSFVMLPFQFNLILKCT
jgi:hypothetical protein